GFVDERGCLKRLAGPFAPHVRRREPAQFVIDDRCQIASGRRGLGLFGAHGPGVGASAHYPRVLTYAANVVVIVMGVAGAGKTPMGRAVGAGLRWRFVEGDELPTGGAVGRMRAAIPLTDADRESWIATLHQIIAAAANRREPLVLSCSALKERYRQALR